jgi:16S rRNA (adenine1518-N6/adenine1519-N6)-dimethyltransferase
MSSTSKFQGHTARKRFGQNFLVAHNVIKQIIDAIAPTENETIVEIGPGLGALTDPLLQRISHLHVVEIDRDLIARLRSRYPLERLTIHQGDALAFDFGALKGRGKLKIIGNLPYNISSPLLFHLVSFAPVVAEMHFMLQKEVVDRMVAIPGTKDFGRLSVMLQYRYQMECLFVVPPESFNPAPKVESAIVRMIPRQPMSSVATGDTPSPQALDEARFAEIVLAAFSQRRKMLRNTLRGHLTDIELSALEIDPMVRAEDVGVTDYVRLSNYLSARQTT